MTIRKILISYVKLDHTLYSINYGTFKFIFIALVNMTVTYYRIPGSHEEVVDCDKLATWIVNSTYMCLLNVTTRLVYTIVE